MEMVFEGYIICKFVDMQLLIVCMVYCHAVCEVRLILDDTSSSSSELLNKLKWQSFPERVKFHKACLVYKCLNDLAPEYLKEIFSSNRSSTNYNLRNNTNMLHVPKANTELFKKSLRYFGQHQTRGPFSDI